MHKQRPSFSRNCQIPRWKETSTVKTPMGFCFEKKHLLLNLYYDYKRSQHMPLDIALN